MVDTVRIADFVVEQARQDEADGCRARGANVCEHAVELADGQRRDVREHDDQGRQHREAELGDGGERRAVAIGRPCGRGEKVAVARGRIAVVGPIRSPLHHRVEGGAARVNLKRDTEHDEDDNRGLANGGGNGRRVHADDVAQDVAAEGQVAGDGDKDIDTRCGTDAGRDDPDNTAWRGILDLVDNGEHLAGVSGARIKKKGTLTQ